MKISYINLDKDLIKQKFMEVLNNTEFLNTDKLELKLSNKDLLAPEILKEEEPVIYITSDAFIKMRALVENCDTEIAWHGTVVRNNMVFLITDIFMYPQHVCSSTVESHDEDYPKWVTELPDDVFNNMRLQGHSHVNMSTGPSGTDESYYHDLIKHVQDFYIVMINNKAGKLMLRLYDIEKNLKYDDLDIRLALTKEKKPTKIWYEEQAKEFIKEKPIAYADYGLGRRYGTGRYVPQPDGHWKYIEEGQLALDDDNFILDGDGFVTYKPKKKKKGAK